MTEPPTRRSTPLISGGVAGVATAIAFAGLHELLISDIWFSVVPMMVAGVLCGVSLSWNYRLSFESPSAGRWLRYLSLHVALLIALGGISIAVFDPVVSISALIAANEPPRELIAQAMPLTVGFTLIAAGGASFLWGRTLPKFGSNLLTWAVLVFLFGLNVSVLGLVDMSGDGAARPVVEFFLLLIVIFLVYGAAYYALERRSSFGATGQGGTA